MSDAPGLLFGIFGPVAVTVLLASATIFLMFHNSRKPRLFILWIIGLHTLVMSAIGLVLISYVLYSEEAGQSEAQRDLRFDSVVATCMGIGILIEGSLLSLVCRLRSSVGGTLPLPSVFKSCIAALIGSAFSIASFIIVCRLFDIVWQLLSPPALSGGGGD